MVKINWNCDFYIFKSINKSLKFFYKEIKYKKLSSIRINDCLMVINDI